MAIVWGKRLVRRRRGVAGCFCPVCRELGVCEVHAVRVAWHLYFVPLGAGKHLVDEVRCGGCGVVQGFSPGGVKAQPGEAGRGDALELAGRSGPAAGGKLARLLDLEVRLGEGRATPDERVAAVTETLHALEYAFQRGRRTSARASVTAVLQLLLIIGLVASAIMWSTFAGLRAAARPFPLWELVVTGATASVLALVCFRMATDRGAGARSLTGAIGTSVRLMRPPLERHEVEAALVRAVEQGSGFARSLAADDVMAKARG